MVHKAKKNKPSKTMPMKLSLIEPFNEANIFLGLIEHELNSLLGAPYLVGFFQFIFESTLKDIC